MDRSSGNTQRNHPNGNAMNFDAQEIILRLNYEIRNRMVNNFNGHVLALNATLGPDLKRHLLADNKRLIQELIDLPVIDGQRRPTEFRLEFSLRNRLLTNVAKNNLFVNHPNNPLFNQQFKSDLLDENNLLIALLNSLEVDDCPANGAYGAEWASTAGAHGQSTNSFERPNAFTANENRFNRHPSASNPNVTFRTPTNQFAAQQNNRDSSTATSSTGHQNHCPSKFTADGLIAEIVRFNVENFSNFLNGKNSVFQNFRISNSVWVIQLAPSKDKVDFFLYCCENREFNIKEVKLWLVDPVSEKTAHDQLYHTVNDFLLTKSQSIKKTIWLDDLVNLSCIRKNTLTLKVVIKLHATG